MAGKSLYFICGALRSGSTMYHLMLDLHPEIHNPGEFDCQNDSTYSKPVVMTGALENIKLAFHNKYYKISCGIKRYSLVLYFLYRSSSKLALKKWHNALLLNINEIDKQDIK